MITPEHARKVAEELLSDEEIMVFADDTHLVSDDSFETYKPYLKAFTAKALAAALVKLMQGEPVAIVALDYNRSQECFELDGRLNGVDWLTPSTMNEKLVPAGTLLFTHPALSQQAAQPAPQAQPKQEPLTDSYVQTVPDHCDRIVWRNHYYHLPLDESAHGIKGETS
jgi:hypothetical protein